MACEQGDDVSLLAGARRDDGRHGRAVQQRQRRREQHERVAAENQQWRCGHGVDAWAPLRADGQRVAPGAAAQQGVASDHGAQLVVRAAPHARARASPRSGCCSLGAQHPATRCPAGSRRWRCWTRNESSQPPMTRPCACGVRASCARRPCTRRATLFAPLPRARGPKRRVFARACPALPAPRVRAVPALRASTHSRAAACARPADARSLAAGARRPYRSLHTKLFARQIWRLARAS